MKESTISKLMGVWFLIVGIIPAGYGILSLFAVFTLTSAIGAVGGAAAGGLAGALTGMGLLFAIIPLILGILALIIAIGLFTVE